ncbi:MAG: signal peptidase II [Myxococcales bacterium]|nr:signal peptidase II [Myxococcales bacterium]
MSASASREPSRASRLFLVGIICVLILALDLWSKQWAWDNLRDKPAVEVIEGFFYLKFGFNTGAAFSFLRDESWARRFFITVTFLALAYMGWLAWKMPLSRRYGFIAVGLIAAGASGNLHDRFVRTDQVWTNGEFVERYGVVDFLQFYYPWNPDKYWPIFNVADTALVCGVFLLLIFLHFHGAETEQGLEEGVAKRKAKSDKAEADADDADGETDTEADGKVRADPDAETVSDGGMAG